MGSHIDRGLLARRNEKLTHERVLMLRSVADSEVNSGGHSEIVLTLMEKRRMDVVCGEAEEGIGLQPIVHASADD